MKCCKCNVIVKNPENFFKKSLDDLIYFYCPSHVSYKNEHLSFCSIDMDTKATSKNTEHSKIILETNLIRQRALEKARLKSDEELGLKLSRNDFSIITPKTNTTPGPKLDEVVIRKLEFIDRRVNNRNPREPSPRNGLILSSKYETKTETDSEVDCESNDEAEAGEEVDGYESKTEDDMFIDDDNSQMMKKLILDDFDRDYQRYNANEKKKNSPAPLATTEAFEATTTTDEAKSHQSKSKWYGLKTLETHLSPITAQSKTKQSFKGKLTKLLATSVLTSPNSTASNNSPCISPVITTSTSVNLKSPTTNNSSGILKSIFNSKSSNSPRHSKNNIDYIKNSDVTNSPIAPMRKKIVPNIDLLSNSTSSSQTNSTNNTSSNSSSASSLDDSSFNANNSRNSDNMPNTAFNALNVTNSPRLSRNSRRAKLNFKRQQNEEKRIEKQRKDQRSRTSQDLQRKLDEINIRSQELEREGQQLELMINGCDKKNKTGEQKMKLEQELYNVIHQRNLLARCENKLNIQSRALAIEDKLSDCQQKLRETMNIPEIEKTIEQIENEKQIMEKIVEYIEEKNQLVEQLESMRILERDEDSEIIKIFSSNFYNMNVGETEIMNKFEPYADII